MYLPRLFAVCLSKGCAVTSEHAETAKLSLHNFLALIASYKELELLPPIDKHQTQTWICYWKMKVRTDTKLLIFPCKGIVHPTIINAKLCANEPH